MARHQSDELEKTKREPPVTHRPASEDVGIRARDPEGTQDSRVRRGGAGGTPAARPPAEARVRVSELLRSPQRAEI